MQAEINTNVDESLNYVVSLLKDYIATLPPSSQYVVLQVSQKAVSDIVKELVRAKKYIETDEKNDK